MANRGGEFEVESRRAVREWTFHVITVPRLRLLGLAMLILLACVNQFWLHPQPVSGILPLGVALTAYGLGSWWLLAQWFTRLRGRLDLGLFFLVLDVPVWSAVIYVCGADHCWFSYVLLARVADQVATRFGRVLFFAHWIPFNYLAMLGCAQWSGHPPADWPAEFCKALVMYLFGVYASLTARTAARLRTRTTQAVRAARQAILELNEARQTAEEASRVKGQFLTMMDHELKTPLNGILGFSELLLQSAAAELSEKQLRYVHNVHSSGLRLGNLVSGILDLAQLKSGELKLNCRQLDPARPLSQAVESLSDKLKARNLRVQNTVGQLPECWADPVRLQQVFFQILDNAVKFSPTAGCISISAEHDAARVRISVRDEGVGIELAQQQRIFEEWKQLDSSYRRLQEGAGIGLTLAQQLCSLHLGGVSVHSQPGQGACFTVELPLIS